MSADGGALGHDASFTIELPGGDWQVSVVLCLIAPLFPSPVSVLLQVQKWPAIHG